MNSLRKKEFQKNRKNLKKELDISLLGWYSIKAVARRGSDLKNRLKKLEKSLKNLLTNAESCAKI